MKKLSLLSVVSAFALAACAPKYVYVPPPAPTVSMIQKDHDSVQKDSQKILDETPDWFLETPRDSEAIYGAGSSSSGDMQFSIEKATLHAQRVVADRLQGKLSATINDFLSDSGTAHSPKTAAKSEQVIKGTLIDVDLSGYEIVKKKVIVTDGIFRSFVMVRYPLGEANTLMVKEVEKDKELDTELRASKAFKDLEDQITKQRESKIAPPSSDEPPSLPAVPQEKVLGGPI